MIAASGVLPSLTPRYGYCIHVDTKALESVLNSPQPSHFDQLRVTYVNLVDELWEPIDPTTFDWENA